MYDNLCRSVIMIFVFLQEDSDTFMQKITFYIPKETLSLDVLATCQFFQC